MKCEGFSLVIFGATGDLTRRKLYPALYNLWLDGLLPPNFNIVAVGRRVKSQTELVQDIQAAVSHFSQVQAESQASFTEFTRHFSYYRLEFEDSLGYSGLEKHLTEKGEKWQTQGNRIYFLAVAPEYFATISNELRQNGMADPQFGWRRLVVEKPFGADLNTAISLNRVVRATFPEENIYRIDHYLGKEMTQNLMVIRFANTLFEPLWNNRYIDHIQITLAETVGVGTRGAYYDQAGALRDMIQNHALQLLALTAMEPPVTLETESIRDEKVKVLRSLKVNPKDVVRGQYTSDQAGTVVGYREEERVAAESQTDTFVAFKATIDNFRWAGVPFYVRTGKRLPQKYVEIVISFNTLPGVLYFEQEELGPNILVIRVQPDEGIYLQFNAKRPGTHSLIQPVSMDFCQTCGNGFNSPEAYERLLYDVMRGDSTLFTRWDEVEHAWKFVDQIASWWQLDDKPVLFYPAKTWGPTASKELLQKEGRDWLRFTEREVKK